MPFNFSIPAPELAPYVKQYWALNNKMSPGESHTQRIIPTGLVELTFYLGSKPKSKQTQRDLSSPSLISGQQNRPYDLTVFGEVSIFSITFHPQGAQLFFDIPLDELCDQTLSLSNIHKEGVVQVETELFEAEGFQEQVQVMNKWLASLLRKSLNHALHPRLLNSIRLIDDSRALVDIETLAKQACLSRKQYERVFKAGVGISPKRFLRIVRLQHAIFKKQLQRDVSLTELAYDCGYYDQSHMIHDFRLLTGLSPRQYFSDCDVYSDYFLL